MKNIFHIHPQTGSAEPCRAKSGNCPFGGEHFDSREGAQAAYEKQMNDLELKTLSKPKKVEKGTKAWVKPSGYQMIDCERPDICKVKSHHYGSRSQRNCSDVAALAPEIYNVIDEIQKKRKIDYNERNAIYESELTPVWKKVLNKSGGTKEEYREKHSVPYGKEVEEKLPEEEVALEQIPKDDRTPQQVIESMKNGIDYYTPKEYEASLRKYFESKGKTIPDYEMRVLLSEHSRLVQDYIYSEVPGQMLAENVYSEDSPFGKTVNSFRLNVIKDFVKKNPEKKLSKKEMKKVRGRHYSLLAIDKDLKQDPSKKNERISFVLYDVEDKIFDDIKPRVYILGYKTKLLDFINMYTDTAREPDFMKVVESCITPSEKDSNVFAHFDQDAFDQKINLFSIGFSSENIPNDKDQLEMLDAMILRKNAAKISEEIIIQKELKAEQMNEKELLESIVYSEIESGPSENDKAELGKTYIETYFNN